MYINFLKIKKQKGVAALPVMMILGMLTLTIAIGITSISFSDMMISQGAAGSAKALVYAEAGARDALMKISRNKDYSCPSTDCYFIDFVTNGCTLGTGCANVSVSSDVGDVVTPKVITSKGVFGPNIRVVKVNVLLDNGTNDSSIRYGQITSTVWSELSDSFSIPSSIQDVVTPTFSLQEGPVALGSTTTISSAGADHIYYTTDGTNPYSFLSGTTLEYSSPLTIDVAKTIKAIAVKTGYRNSSISSATYTQASVSDLSNLVVSGSPSGFSFSGSTYTYSGVTVPYLTSSVTVTPTGSGTITVEGVTVSSGQASGSISLTAGQEKTITVVASETGKTSKTYTINITRAGVTTSGGTITYTDSNGLNPRSSPAYAGGYTVHTFTSGTSTFTSNAPLTVQVLVVAGGGSSGIGHSPAPYYTRFSGGAGGLIYTSYDVSVGDTTVTVGAGGTGATSYGVKGENSVFGTLTAIGGGGGGGYNGSQWVCSPAPNYCNGGSGGASDSSLNNGTANQGNNGGVMIGNGTAPGSGGAGSAGGNGGGGGTGLTYSISGTNVTYATGGGGTGVSNQSPVANSGNGGISGVDYSSSAVSGSSGVVIVRYPTGGN